MTPDFSAGPELRALCPRTHAAEDVIRLLDLAPLPAEGGWFRRTAEAERAPGADRAAWSVILALFTPEQFSAFHVVQSADEIWCFQAGDPLELVQLHRGGAANVDVLGLDLAAGQRPHAVVASGTWQAARVASGRRWSLVTCLVVPEFRWPDFSLGDRATLLAGWPAWADRIRELTR
jgi:predicted cupin superfamily sugar epimerase